MKGLQFTRPTMTVLALLVWSRAEQYEHELAEVTGISKRVLQELLLKLSKADYVTVSDVGKKRLWRITVEGEAAGKKEAESWRQLLAWMD